MNARDKRNKSETTTQRQPKTIPQSKMSPKKKSKVDLTEIQFECDTSISLLSDTELDHKTSSPEKQPAAKWIDIKATPEQKSPEIRRSTRARKGTSAERIGNAIPIGQISHNTEALITVATIQETNSAGTAQNETNNNTRPVDKPTTVAENTPVNKSPSSQATSEEILWTEIQMDIDTPEKTRKAETANDLPPRTTSSHYILDKPRTTEDCFSKEIEDAMNFLQSISPIRGNSMTFQREKERANQQSGQHQPQPTTFRGNQCTTTEKKDRVSNKQDAEEN